jgi:flagellar hook-associated protein 1 FlgK
MGITQALTTAVAGLRVTQANLSLVAANVSNAETPGYVRKTPNQIATSAGSYGVSVRTTGVNRELDQHIQRQLRTESSGGAYAELRARLYTQLQNVYGPPSSDTTISATFNNFTTALQAFTTSPEDVSARAGVLRSGQTLAQQLNEMTRQVQALRSSAELGLKDSVNRANQAIERVADINRQLGTNNGNDGTTAALLDQRDMAIDELAQLMDIRVIATDFNQVTVFTNSGIQLVGTAAASLSFDPQGTMTPSAHWSADPAERTVGTLVLQAPNGGDLDLIASKSIRSGEIAAYLEMRDKVLVEAQAQLDQLAAAMSKAMSDKTTTGTAVTAGAQAGFDLDVSALQNGDTFQFSYLDVTTNTQRKITIVRVDDPAALPLSAADTAGPANATTVGIDFSGGMASVVAQLGALFGSRGLTISTPAASTIRVMDDGGVRSTMQAGSTTATVTGLASGNTQLPFFNDVNTPYTGSFSVMGSQSIGYAGRITVHAGLLADPSKLVNFTGSTPAGDGTRPTFLYNQMTQAAMTYSPTSGIGAALSPYSGTLSSFLQSVISQQGEAANGAQNLADGQAVVVNALRERMSATSGVSIDQEMADLLQLQNTYAANARVMSTVREMLATLMQM